MSSFCEECPSWLRRVVLCRLFLPTVVMAYLFSKHNILTPSEWRNKENRHHDENRKCPTSCSLRVAKTTALVYVFVRSTFSCLQHLTYISFTQQLHWKKCKIRRWRDSADFLSLIHSGKVPFLLHHVCFSPLSDVRRNYFQPNLLLARRRYWAPVKFNVPTRGRKAQGRSKQKSLINKTAGIERERKKGKASS